MTRNEQRESKASWYLRFISLGIGASIAAIGVALLVDAAVDPGWPWTRIAIVLLGVITVLLIVATTSAGSGIPTGGASYDRCDAYIEAQGKQMAGTPQYQPSRAGIDALLAFLPPLLTAVVLLIIYGW